MILTLYLKSMTRLFCRRLFPILFMFTLIYFIFIYGGHPDEPSYDRPITRIYRNVECKFKPSTEEFILRYKPNKLLGTKVDSKRAEPTVERIRTLLEIIRSHEDKYQSLLETFDVFNMLNPNDSLRPYTDNSNIDEIKILYNRYIKLMPDKQTVQINETFIDYLRKTSSYLSDGLKNKRTEIFQVKCNQKPVFVLACDKSFFNGLQGAIHTLDTYWPNHKIAFYDLGLGDDQRKLLSTKCRQCTIIPFPFSSIKKVAEHIEQLGSYAFKPFVVQDALRRYGSIIYGDSSARFKNNSFDPVLTDNYIRGFAARELPDHFLPCFTYSEVFTWFNQSYTQYNDIYMAEANFLVVTDTFLTRLIMKAWLTCALDPGCLNPFSETKCSRNSVGAHRFDQSAMVIILTYFFFQGDQGAWSRKHLNDPTPYDMFTSIQMNLGDIKRGAFEPRYLLSKMISSENAYKGVFV